MIRVLISVLFLATSAAAQSANPCGWQASAQAIVEPWEDNTRLYANGKVRIAYIDTTEPAAGAAYLLVLSPPFGETGERQCRVIGASDRLGFAGLDFDQLQAGYDAAVGLVFALPVSTLEGDAFARKVLVVTLNQSNGAMTARYRAIAE